MTQTAPAPASQTIQPASVVLEARGISKIYPSGESTVVALHDVSVGFEAGRITAIVGPSGSGKSTCQKAAPASFDLVDLLTRQKIFWGALNESVEHIQDTTGSAWMRGLRACPSGRLSGSSISMAICVHTLRHKATAFSLCTR